jgi:DNA-binding IclR family transcriptional regulator
MTMMVGRTLSFLELFALQKRPLSGSDIARMLDIPTSSCHDVVRVLETRGYLYKTMEQARWYPTLRLLQIAETLAANDPVIPRMLAPLRQFRDAVDESVLLSTIDGLRARYLLVLEPSHTLRYVATIGECVRSLHAASAGKALLGSLSAAALNGFLESAELTRYTPKTIVSAAALREHIAIGNERGWFLNAEESEPGLTTLSCRFSRGSAIYIVTVAGPTPRFQPNVTQACQLLTQLCGQLGERG